MSGTDGVDAYVQVAADSTGKKISSKELTRGDDSVVERQEVVIGDPNNTEDGGAAEVKDRRLQVEDRSLQVLEAIHEELKELRLLIAMALKG